LPEREQRPDDGAYYEVRRPLFSLGDIFRDVPREYPVPHGLVVDENESQGKRIFLAGPLSFGNAMLINPTCSMRAQGADGYAYPSRTLVPIISVEEAADFMEKDKVGLARKYDCLKNYMYLPANSDLKLSEGFALLYMPITLHHDFLTADGQRITQLSRAGAQQLARKLVVFYSDRLVSREQFDPPMD
jgi:hypothetical protein